MNEAGQLETICRRAPVGVWGVVGVLSGTRGIEPLGKVRRTHLIGSVAELPDLMERAFGEEVR